MFSALVLFNFKDIISPRMNFTKRKRTGLREKTTFQKNK